MTPPKAIMVGTWKETGGEFPAGGQSIDDAHQLYAAFGSNLDAPRLRRRVGSAEVAGRCRIRGWSLGFAGRGVATAERTKGGVLPVVLYWLTPMQLLKLDSHEGRYYDRIEFLVRATGKAPRPAWTYLHSYAPSGAARPAADYLGYIIRGLAAHGFKRESELLKVHPTSYSPRRGSVWGPATKTDMADWSLPEN